MGVRWAFNFLIAAALANISAVTYAKEALNPMRYLRIQPDAGTFDPQQSSVIGGWMHETGKTSLNVALSFRPPAGTPESMDVVTQGRIHSYHALGLLAFYAPNEAEKLFDSLNTYDSVAGYAGNMFSYPLDVAAFELEQAFLRKFSLAGGPKLRAFILSLFESGFMQQPAAAVLTSLNEVLALKKSGSGSGQNYFDSLEAMVGFFDQEMAGWSPLNIRQYSSPTDINAFSYVQERPSWLRIDFSKYECYYYEYSRELGRSHRDKYNNGLMTYAIYSSRGDPRKEFYFDARSHNSSFSDMDPAMVIGMASDSMYYLQYYLGAYNVTYPLPPEGSDPAVPVIGDREHLWPTRFCVERVPAEKNRSEDSLRLRYVFTQVRDGGGQTDSEALATQNDIKLREILKMIATSYKALIRQKAAHLNHYIANPNALFRDRAVQELAVLDSLFKNDMGAAVAGNWHRVHARRVEEDSKPAQIEINAFGFEVDVPILGVGTW